MGGGAFRNSGKGIVLVHAGKLLIEIGPTFFVTIYLCEFLCY